MDLPAGSFGRRSLLAPGACRLCRADTAGCRAASGPVGDWAWRREDLSFQGGDLLTGGAGPQLEADPEHLGPGRLGPPAGPLQRGRRCAFRYHCRGPAASLRGAETMVGPFIST